MGCPGGNLRKFLVILKFTTMPRNLVCLGLSLIYLFVFIIVMFSFETLVLVGTCFSFPAQKTGYVWIRCSVFLRKESVRDFKENYPIINLWWLRKVSLLWFKCLIFWCYIVIVLMMLFFWMYHFTNISIYMLYDSGI